MSFDRYWDINEKCKKMILKLLPYIMLLLVITLMMSYQLATRSVLIASDAWVHFYRFYDTEMQIKTGNFSYFQTNYGFYHSGRIFNTLYGPLFAYLNGALLIICRNWFVYQIVVEYLVLLIAGIGMYKLCQKVKINALISLLLASIYLQFGIVISIFRFNWMAWGAALTPYVLMQAVNMIQDKARPIHWISLALIMSLIAQVHFLSTIVLAATLIPFYLYSLVISNNKKQILINLVKALLLTLVLTANIWGAFVLLYPNNHIALPNTFNLNTYALHLSKFSSLHAHVSYTIAILILLQVIYVLFHFKQSKLNTISTLVSVVILLISSRYFPWIKIQHLYPKLGASFQFPYRLTLGAYPLMLLASGISINEIIKKYGSIARKYLTFALVLVLLQNFSFNIIANYVKCNSFLNSNRVVVMSSKYSVTNDKKKLKYIIRHTSNEELFEAVKHVEPDYLSYKDKVSNKLYAKGIVDQSHKYSYKVQGSKLILKWHNKKSKRIYLPIVMYHQSKLVVNGKNKSNVHKNNIMQPLIKSRKGSNYASLQFITPIWFKIILWITLLSWMGLVGYKLWNKISSSNWTFYGKSKIARI